MNDKKGKVDKRMSRWIMKLIHLKEKKMREKLINKHNMNGEKASTSS